MALENSTLFLEIDDIFRKSKKPPETQWECLIITPVAKHRPIKLLSIDIVRNYKSNWADNISLELSVPLGMLNFDIKPHREELKLELTRKKIGVSLEEPDFKTDYTKVYRMYLTDETNSTLSAESRASNSKEVSDISDTATIKVDLLEPAVELLRLYTLGGIYNDNVPLDVLRYLLTDLSGKLELPKEEGIAGVDVVKADNTTKTSNIIIPHGTRPQDLASVLQMDCGGIYGTDIGMYLQDNLWYVWPLYNQRRFEEGGRNLLLVNIAANKFPGVERTWKLRGKQLVVLSTGDSVHTDPSNALQLNQGTGVRYVGATRVMQGFGDQGFGSDYSSKDTTGRVDNKCIVDKTKNVSEFNSITREGYSHVPFSDDKITDNAFAQTSKIASRNGSFVTMVWENSVPEFIYPGMPTKVVYLKSDGSEEVLGVVVNVQHQIKDSNNTPVVGKQRINTAVTVFVEKVITPK